MVGLPIVDVAFALTSLLDDLCLLVLGPLDEFTVALGNVLSALCHPIRRSVLAKLARDGSVTRRTLAETVAADGAVDEADVDRVEVSLHHNHLPKLADEGYLDYDRRHGDVVLWEDPETVRALIDSR